jgi:hypothetical protein
MVTFGTINPIDEDFQISFERVFSGFKFEINPGISVFL